MSYWSKRAAVLAAAIVEMGSKDPNWSESAQGMMHAGMMFEEIEARRQRQRPSMLRPARSNRRRRSMSREILSD